MTAGRRTKLTPEVQAKIVAHIERGFTLVSAAHHSGVSKSSFFYWLRKGEKATDGEFMEFSDSVRAALEKRKEVRIKANPRRFARARYERNQTAQEIAQKLAQEVDRLITQGRVPWNVALVGLGMVQSEIEDKLAEESLSWADNDTPAFDNTRARMEDDES